MGKILSQWRGVAQQLLFVFLPVCAFVVMNHASFSSMAENVNSSLGNIENSKIQLQMTTPCVLSQLLPRGLAGMFAAVILAAFVSTHDTYLHSWGSIFVQDVISPLRKKPFTPRQHMLLLRLSIIGIAIFVCIFSALYNQTQHIWMFWAVTSAVYLGGAGSVVIGGLYSRKGTTFAAYSAMIVGTVLAIVGFSINQIFEDFFINGQWFYLISMLSAAVTYVIVTVFTYKRDYDLDKLFHRKNNSVNTKTSVLERLKQPSLFLRIIGITKEFSRGDLFIYIGMICWAMLFFLLFLIGTIYGAIFGISPKTWVLFWKIYVIFSFVVGVITTIWFLFGGLSDLKSMFAILKTAPKDNLDDGTVYSDDKD